MWHSENAVPGEEKVPNEEYEVREGPELDRPAVVSAIRVFAGPEAEIEANCDQVRDLVGSGVIGAGCHGNNGVNDSQGDNIFSPDGGIIGSVGLELMCEALV